MGNKPKTIKLIELTAELESGSRPSGGASSETDGIPSLGAEHLNDHGGFNFSNIKYVPMEFFNSMKRGVIKQDDILIVKDGATTGKVSFVNGNFPFEQASINEHVFSLRINKEKALPKYIFYRLFSEEGKKAILKDFRGATVGGISKGFTEKVSIPLPSIQFQQKIAAILDKADALRQRDKQLLAKYDELAQAVFYDMFGDPVRNEKGWDIKMLGEVVTEVKDGPHVSPEYTEVGVPILSTRNIRPAQLIMDDVKYVSESTYNTLTKRFKPQKDDILLTKGGTTGYAKLVDFDFKFCIWVHLAALRPSKNVINPKFLESVLNCEYCYSQSQKYTHGITNKDLGLTRMIKIKLPVPPKEVQDRFVVIIENIEYQKKRAQEELQKSEKLFQSLLHKAFNEELIA